MSVYVITHSYVVTYINYVHKKSLETSTNPLKFNSNNFLFNWILDFFNFSFFRHAQKRNKCQIFALTVSYRKPQIIEKGKMCEKINVCVFYFCCRCCDIDNTTQPTNSVSPQKCKALFVFVICCWCVVAIVVESDKYSILTKKRE